MLRRHIFFSHIHIIYQTCQQCKGCSECRRKAYVEKPRRFLNSRIPGIRDLYEKDRTQPLRHHECRTTAAVEIPRHTIRSGKQQTFERRCFQEFRRSRDDRLRSRAFRIADEQRRQSIPVEKRYVKHDASKHQRAGHAAPHSASRTSELFRAYILSDECRNRLHVRHRNKKYEDHQFFGDADARGRSHSQRVHQPDYDQIRHFTARI